MAKKRKGWLSRLFGGGKEEVSRKSTKSERTEEAQNIDTLSDLEAPSSTNHLEEKISDSDFEEIENTEKTYGNGNRVELEELLEDEIEEIIFTSSEDSASESENEKNETDEAIDAVSALIAPTEKEEDSPTSEILNEENEGAPELQNSQLHAPVEDDETVSNLPSLNEEFVGEKEEASATSEAIQEEGPGDKPSKKRGFFARLSERLSKTRTNLTEGIADLFLGKKEIDEEILEELETRLLLADVGINVTEQMLDEIRTQVSRKSLSNADELFAALKAKMIEILTPVEAPLEIPKSDKPYVLLMIGVNGVGKTTTIGKLAKKFQIEGHSVMLAAGDTFRAAAVEQLEVWGERNQIPVISQKEGADPASVVFDAMESSKARNVDILIADTAGRLHTDSGLMQELAKINRVIKRHDESAPHEVMLVVDASTGQNALNQARQFNETIPLSGITFTKMDGTAKGGIIFAIADELKIPVRFIGVGESIDDLRPFDAEEFVEALIGDVK